MTSANYQEYNGWSQEESSLVGQICLQEAAQREMEGAHLAITSEYSPDSILGVGHEFV